MKSETFSGMFRKIKTNHFLLTALFSFRVASHFSLVNQTWGESDLRPGKTPPLGVFLSTPSFEK